MLFKEDWAPANYTELNLERKLMFVKEEEAVIWRGDFLFVHGQMMSLIRVVSYGSDCQIILKVGNALVPLEQCTDFNGNVVDAFWLLYLHF